VAIVQAAAARTRGDALETRHAIAERNVARLVKAGDGITAASLDQNQAEALSLELEQKAAVDTARANAAQGQAFANSQPLTGASGLTPQVKDMISAEVQRQVALENAEAQTVAQHADPDPASSGIQRMLDACRAVGIPEPSFEESTGGLLTIFRKAKTPAIRKSDLSTDQVTGQVAVQVTGQVADVLKHVHGEVTRSQLQKDLRLKGRANFLRLYLFPALKAGLLEMTIPAKPNSRLQKYRLTAKGRTATKK